jgi:hypothetical protein
LPAVSHPRLLSAETRALPTLLNANVRSADCSGLRMRCALLFSRSL